MISVKLQTDTKQSNNDLTNAQGFAPYTQMLDAQRWHGNLSIDSAYERYRLHASTLVRKTISGYSSWPAGHIGMMRPGLGRGLTNGEADDT